MKKINGEVKIENDLFKIKIGTTDKKHPEIIYIEIGSYVSPVNEKETYKTDIETIEKSTKKFLTELFRSNTLCESNFIFVSDVADERITKGKKSYMEMQIFVRPKAELKCKKFSEIAEKMNLSCISSILPTIENTIKSNGFECYKTRK